MRNPFRKQPVDPAEAMRLAQEAMANTNTMIDEHGRRVKIPPEQKAQMEAALRNAAEQLPESLEESAQ